MASHGKVLATGFNLHGQLDPALPEDLDHFMQIQHLDHVDFDKDKIIACPRWSATIFNTCRKFVHRGVSGTNPEQIHFDELIDLEGRPKRGKFFGDVGGVKGFLENKTGDIHTLEDSGNNNARFIEHTFQANHFLPRTGKTVVDIAIAGNMKVCIAFNSQDSGVSVFSNLDALLQGSDPIETYISHDTVKSLQASSTTFTILGQQRARVETFGDPRYPSLLGRVPSPQSPASIPTVISALDGIDMTKISAGSWLIAAVSREKDLYVWGHVMQQPMADDSSFFKRLLDTPEDVHLVDIPDGQDIEDVAVGDEHLVVLTTKAELWGYGSNKFGQLGLGRDVKTTEGKWVKLYTAGVGEEIREIAAGPLSTFIAVECDALDR